MDSNTLYTLIFNLVSFTISVFALGYALGTYFAIRSYYKNGKSKTD